MNKYFSVTTLTLFLGLVFFSLVSSSTESRAEGIPCEQGPGFEGCMQNWALMCQNYPTADGCANAPLIGGNRPEDVVSEEQSQSFGETNNQDISQENQGDVDNTPENGNQNYSDGDQSPQNQGDNGNNGSENLNQNQNQSLNQSQNQNQGSGYSGNFGSGGSQNQDYGGGNLTEDQYIGETSPNVETQNGNPEDFMAD